MKYAIEQRLRFIEATLQETGTINRADIMAKFRISLPQASTDIGHYQALAPRNITYDPRAKTYRRGEKFKPYFKD